MSYDETYAANGALIERADTVARTVTCWDEQGVLIPSTTEAPNPRPYTPEENAAADAAAVVEAARAEREADRAAARALVDGINASIDEAKAAKAAAQTVIDAVAPTNVAQTWTRVKDLARAVRDTDNALIGAERGVKALAKYVRDQ